MNLETLQNITRKAKSLPVESKENLLNKYIEQNAQKLTDFIYTKIMASAKSGYSYFLEKIKLPSSDFTIPFAEEALKRLKNQFQNELEIKHRFEQILNDVYLIIDADWSE